MYKLFFVYLVTLILAIIFLFCIVVCRLEKWNTSQWGSSKTNFMWTFENIMRKMANFFLERKVRKILPPQHCHLVWSYDKSYIICMRVLEWQQLCINFRSEPTSWAMAKFESSYWWHWWKAVAEKLTHHADIFDGELRLQMKFWWKRHRPDNTGYHSCWGIQYRYIFMVFCTSLGDVKSAGHRSYLEWIFG